jgi:4-carboxymuconolactone decarboxylase
MADFISPDKEWGGRLPRLEAIQLDDAQKTAFDELQVWAGNFDFAATDSDGGLIGPFIATVLRPAPGKAFQEWVAADYRGSSLPRDLREVVILAVGTHWASEYELYAHVQFARGVGLPEAAIDSVLHGVTDGLNEEQLLAHAFTIELLETHRVSDSTYQSAYATFGRDGILDLVHVIAMYAAQSAMLNAFNTPAP